MTDRSTRGTRRDTGRAFIWALALFAIACGVILMLVGTPSNGTETEGDRDSMKSVIIVLDAAANALEDRNYGRTKTLLRSARERLTRLDE